MSAVSSSGDRKRSVVLCGLLIGVVRAVVGAAMVDCIDPMIGAVTYPEHEINNVHGFGKTFPGATTPFGMVQLSPDTITGGDNGSGYSYSHKTIEGFSLMHMSGIGWYGEFGNFQVLPTVGARQFDREKACSPFSHEQEVAKAGYYQVDLLRYGIRVELTAGPRTGFYRFTYPKCDSSRIQIDLGRRIGQKDRWLAASEQTVRVVGSRAIEGKIHCPHADGGWGRGDGFVMYTVHYRAEFSKPIEKFGVWDRDEVFEGLRAYSGTNVGFFVEFPTDAGEQVEMRVGVSFVDVEGARKNLLADAPAFDFDGQRERARARWMAALEGIAVKGGTERERTIFATALYHAFIDPRAVADVDGRYRAADRTIGQSDDFVQRTVFSGWDVFRSAFPLYTLVRPDIVSDTVNSMLDVVRRGVRPSLPVWDIFGCGSSCMLGNPLIPVMADAWEKGIRTFDGTYALEQAVRTMNMKYACNLPNGWYPGSLSYTLEHAYDDWCVARLAEMQGRDDLAQTHFSRAKWYTNCWDRTVGWMRARNEDGSWKEWKGRTVHGQGCAESNPYQQGWFVPHDPEGLVRLMGGRGKFTDELERFFEGTPADFQWNDYYNHPNEPCHFIPYQFAFSEKPWLTQKWTRRILAQAYGTGPYGLCGNEDVGQMSAWYVLSAIGLHPNCPGDGRWYLTSPIFTETVIRLDPKYYPGGTFTIRAPKADAEHVYIRSVRLNGKTLDRLWISTKEVSAGGILELDLAPTSER